MLKVLPVRDKELQKDYCLRCGMVYDPDQMCYAAHEEETFLGISLFRIVGKACVIDKVTLTENTVDPLALHLLGKAPLNFADLCGIQEAIFRDSNKALARELEFIEKDGVFTVNLEGYFTSPCSRHSHSGQSND